MLPTMLEHHCIPYISPPKNKLCIVFNIVNSFLCRTFESRNIFIQDLQITIRYTHQSFTCSVSFSHMYLYINSLGLMNISQAMLVASSYLLFKITEFAIVPNLLDTFLSQQARCCKEGSNCQIVLHIGTLHHVSLSPVRDYLIRMAIQTSSRT